jgi:hypothetical protein
VVVTVDEVTDAIVIRVTDRDDGLTEVEWDDGVVRVFDLDWWARPHRITDLD